MSSYIIFVFIMSSNIVFNCWSLLFILAIKTKQRIASVSFGIVFIQENSGKKKCKFMKVFFFFLTFKKILKFTLNLYLPPVTKTELKLWTYAHFLVFLYNFYLIIICFVGKIVYCYVTCSFIYLSNVSFSLLNCNCYVYVHLLAFTNINTFYSFLIFFCYLYDLFIIFILFIFHLFCNYFSFSFLDTRMIQNCISFYAVN